MSAEFGSVRPDSSRFGYWLGRCEGFRVDSPHGRVGFVDELRYSSSAEKPDAIAVGAGRFGRRVLIIPTGEVEEIFPKEERMLLRRSPRLAATESVREVGRRPAPAHTRERGIEQEGR